MTHYVGIPTINNLGYLQQTLDSIKTKYEHRILLIDNMSTDGRTREWISDSTNHSCDIILNNENVGVAQSWNQIINWALSFDDCGSIFILNNDIVLGEDTLNTLIEDITKEGLEACSGVNLGNNPIMLQSFNPGKSRWSRAMNFSCFALTPKCVKRVGLFDEGFKRAYFEDNDYHHRMMLEGIHHYCDLWAPFIHYGSRSIKEGGVKHEPYFTDNKNYFKRKWGFIP